MSWEGRGAKREGEGQKGFTSDLDIYDSCDLQNDSRWKNLLRFHHYWDYFVHDAIYGSYENSDDYHENHEHENVFVALMRHAHAQNDYVSNQNDYEHDCEHDDCDHENGH